MTNSTVDITALPEAVATALNCSEFVAGLIMSAVFLAIFLLPFVFIKRSKGFLAEMMVGITLVCFLIGVQWLPYWVGLIIALLVAVMLSGKIKDWLG